MRTLLVCCLVALAVSASAPRPFTGKKSYTYRFDTQVSSSLIGASPADVQQAATTRISAMAQLAFTSDRIANLQLRNIRIGELNSDLPKSSQRVQPLEHFEKKELTAEVKETLEYPLQVTITDGVVEKIYFHEDDSTWSKNIKRAVLNMLQLNLKKNDVQGLKMQSSMPEQNQDTQSPMFSIPEITLEGACEVVYTVQKNSRFGSENDENTPFNVTKTINFNKCQETADLSFGYQSNPSQQLRCFQCLNQRRNQQQNPEEREQARLGHCQQECQANKPNEEKDVEKSTFARFELVGNQDKYAIKRSSLVSQYVLKAQNPASQNTLVQIVAISELNFKEEGEQQKTQPFKQSTQEDTLLYSNEFEKTEKRFYMNGDEEFEKQSPFHQMQRKENKVGHSIKSVIKQWRDKQQGYELDSALNFKRLVDVIRKSSVHEIRAYEQVAQEVAQQQQEEGQSSEHSKELGMTIYYDALAAAGTRNSLFVLAEKIMKSEISTLKAAQLLKTYTASQIAPSESQANILEKIAKHEVAHRCPVLKQTAWLSFGQAVGAICQDKPAQGQKQHFNVERVCSIGKKEQYKKTLMSLWEKAESTYEKIIALKSMGNAALDNTINELKQIAKDNQQPTLIRMEAIDAMRRLRTSMPQKIQQVLLPIFQNQREQPEIRMAAFSMILSTQPTKAVLDQMVFTTVNDRSQNVKSFVLTALESLSKSPVNVEQETANHLKSALKMIRLGPQELRSSRKYRVPIYTNAGENTEEQNVFLALTSIVSPSNMIPIHLATSIRSAFGGEATQNNFELSFTQKNLQQWFERLHKYVEQYGQDGDEQTERKFAKDLSSIYSSLNVKNRRSGSYFLSSSEDSSEQEQGRRSMKAGDNEPFGMIVLRTHDVDYAVVPVSQSHLPEMVRKLMNGEKPSILSQLSQTFEQLSERLGHFRQHIGISIEKKTKIASTSGLPITFSKQLSAVGSIEGELKARFESASLSSSRGLTAELKLRSSGIATHVHGGSVWSPAVVSGVESVRTVELNTPVDLRMQADKNSGLELKMRLPQEHRVRVAAIHTLPVTFTRSFDMKTMSQKEARVKTVNNWALEHLLRESQQKDTVIQVEGHYHHVSTIKQFLQAIYTTENNVHVYFAPTNASPKELKMVISGSAFQKHSSSGPEMNSFYSKNRGFQSIYEDEEEDMSTERQEQYRQGLSSYTQKYSSNQNALKHELKMELIARCNNKDHRATVQVSGACDDAHCRLFVDAERSQMHDENGKWTLSSKIQTAAPQMIGQNDEQMSNKQSRIQLIQLDSQWGSESQEPSKMNIRLQVRKQRDVRFLNKIDMVADYKLHSQAKHVVDRLYQLLKAKLFWSMSSSLEAKQSEEGIVRATIVVDPATGKTVNLTVQTPQERLRAQGIELPIRAPQYTLQRRSTPIKSFGQLIQNVVSFGGAQCKANDRRVKTFDGVSYRAPLSSGCWSVLAKDCSRDEPRFAVLMKKSGEETRVKIVTPRKTIELIGKESNKLTVKINGQQEKDEQTLNENGIEQSYDGVYVSIAGVKVEFDGEEAKLSVSGMYKNLQCGLCGHYSDEDDDTFAMPNGRRSNSIRSFHQSYTLRNQECDSDKLNKFYEQDSNEFSIQPRQQSRRQQQWSDDDESDESSSEEYGQSEQQKGGRKQPVDRTKIIEYTHKLCFSVSPVKQCPRGTVPDNEAETKSKKVEFFCLDRTSSQARKLQRQVRQGKIVESDAAPSSFAHEVELPTRCQVAAY